jgi:membrane protease YdiL (CAAX protease family)
MLFVNVYSMEKPTFRTTLTELLLHNIWAKIAEILLIVLLVLIVLKTFSPMVENDLIRKQLLIWIINVIMIIWVFLGMKIRGESLSDFGLDFTYKGIKSLLKLIMWSLIVFVLAALAFVVGSIIMANITGIPEQADMSGYDYFQGRIGLFLVSMLGIYFVSSFGEEFFYRAFLINRITEMGISKKWGVYIAVLLSAIVFGFAHYQWGPMGIVQTTFMGLALGICYLWLKKKLLILVLAHAYMDTILMLQLYLGHS